MPSLTRRSFAETLTLAALSPVLGLSWPSLRPGPAGSRAMVAGSAGEPGAMARALLEVLRLEHGSRLPGSEVAGLAWQIQQGLDRAAALRRAEVSLVSPHQLALR
jgi:hypothetical protein